MPDDHSDSGDGDNETLGTFCTTSETQYEAKLPGVSYKVNHHCKEEILSSIRTILNNHGAMLFNRFEQSCFGKFYDFPGKLGKSMSTVHELMTYQIVNKKEQPYTTRELCFFVKGKVVKFHREEFAIVTGLRFGGSEFNPHKKRHFLNHDSMYANWYVANKTNFGRLWDDYKASKFKTGEEYLKASKILFVHSILLGVQNTKTIDEWIWVLVEHEDWWENFPWGSFAYQHLIQNLDFIRTDRNGEGKTRGYHLNGFVTAFLGWIMCAIPEVGKESGLRNENCIPRMLRYDYSSALGDLVEMIDEIEETLKPSDDELESIY